MWRIEQLHFFPNGWYVGPTSHLKQPISPSLIYRMPNPFFFFKSNVCTQYKNKIVWKGKQWNVTYSWPLVSSGGNPTNSSSCLLSDILLCSATINGSGTCCFQSSFASNSSATHLLMYCSQCRSKSTKFPKVELIYQRIWAFENLILPNCSAMMLHHKFILH